MTATLLLALLAFACTDPKPGDTDSSAPDSPTDTATDTGDTGGTGSSADEDALRALIASMEPGAEQVEATLADIALSDGLPVRTAAGTFLFACACGAGNWRVAGDFDAWVGTSMTRNGALSWAEVVIPAPEDQGYKFWDGADTWTADPWARRFLYDEFGEISQVRARAPHLERWPGFEGDGLEPRTLRVWVPQDAAFDRVLYAHDGQNLFDPEAMWGGWRLQESVPEGMLVVGIDNTWERDWEYTHVEDWLGDGWYGGGGDVYAAFVQERVRPFVAARYGDAALHGLLGSSLGGLISLHVASVYEGEYAFAASLSGTLGWGSIGADPPNPTMIQIHEAAGHRGTAIYLDSGGGESCPGSGGACADRDRDGTWDDVDDGDNYCETVQMRDTLAGLGYTFEVDLWHWNEPCAEHNEMAWAARANLPLGVFQAL